MTAVVRTTPVVVVTGLSGAGKASTLRAMEDIGYEAVDNPPLTLVDELVARASQPLAIGLDARSRGFDAPEVIAMIDRLRALPGIAARLVFIWAETPVLLRRFTETRRRHPLAPQGRVVDGIEHETSLTLPLRSHADLVLDTSELPLAELRRVVTQQFGLQDGTGQTGMTVTIVSFAFPAGLPREADMVFDARFLRNPHYDPILRPRTGQDPDVAAYVEADPDFAEFYASITSLLRLVLPRFVQEGKKYATIAVGCTGGRHRSVRIAERLGAELGSDTWRTTVVHRELTKAAMSATDAPLVERTLSSVASGKV
ncbi:MAG: RNase adapter RapZ [Janthinobacterium lividum]